MRGVGRGAQTCSPKVNLVGAFHDDNLSAYEAPVLNDDDVCLESAGVPLALCVKLVGM